MSVQLSLSFTNIDQFNITSGNPLLIKIWVSDRKKYYIWKIQFLKTISKNLIPQLTRELSIPKPDSIFSKLVSSVKKSKIGSIEIEIIKVYSDKFELLVDEYNLLNECKSDRNCLNKNTNNINHYPNWISQDDINNFKKYYTTGKNIGSSNKDKNLLRFLNSFEMDDVVRNRIYSYVKNRYK